MGITKEDLLKFINGLPDDEKSNGDSQPSEDNQQPAGNKANSGDNEPPAQKEDNELKAVQAELARLKALEEQKEKKEEESSEKEKAQAELSELQKRIQHQENKALEASVEASLVKKGFDSEAAKKILPFAKYDSLKTSEGEVDEEKVTEFVDTVTSIALRNPPKSEKKPSSLSPNSQGMGKYIRK